MIFLGSLEAILTFICIVSDILCSCTGFQEDNELIFLGCLKISWTDPPDADLLSVPSGLLHGGGGFSAKFRIGGAAHSFKM